MVWWVLTTTAAMALLLSPSQKCTCFRPITPNTPRVKLIFYIVQTACTYQTNITQSSGLKTHQEFNLHITSIGIYLVFIICFVFLEVFFFIYWKVEKIGQWALDVHLKFRKNKTHQKCRHSWSSITRDPLNGIWGIEYFFCMYVC